MAYGVRRVSRARILIAAALAAAAFAIADTAQAHVVGAASIVGVVRAASGAVLRGVTVEAASAALIEKTRAATTDGQVHYLIVDLRPGTYIVTFTVAGFSTSAAKALTGRSP
jgi:hypothetical protein